MMNPDEVHGLLADVSEKIRARSAETVASMDSACSRIRSAMDVRDRRLQSINARRASLDLEESDAHRDFDRYVNDSMETFVEVKMALTPTGQAFAIEHKAG